MRTAEDLPLEALKYRQSIVIICESVYSLNSKKYCASLQPPVDLLRLARYFGRLRGLFPGRRDRHPLPRSSSHAVNRHPRHSPLVPHFLHFWALCP